jgi:hypothetical protein
MMKTLTKAALAFALTTFAAGMLTAAAALPLGRSAPASMPEAVLPVELAHGCHRGVQRDYSGWHFHTRACVRVNTPPPGLYDGPSYRRVYRGPVCSYQCRLVGPVKTCQQVCR